MTLQIAERLRSLGVVPSAQRVAVAEFVLSTCTHPGADEVHRAIQARIPTISLATVYNTLHLFAEKGLLRELAIADDRVVFDCMVEPHHHIIDVDTGAIHDLPWNALQVKRAEAAAAGLGFEVSEYQVVLRGRKKRAGKAPAAKARKGR
jgi:Fur family transcriptional regulator, iron response regulator